MEIIFYSHKVVTPICISLNLEHIWPNEVYVDRVYHHTRPSRVLYMTSVYVYLEYMVILILYATIIVLYNILKDMCSFEIFSHSKDLVYLNISMSTYSKYWSCPPIYCSPSILDHQTSTHKHPEQSCTKQTKRYN